MRAKGTWLLAVSLACCCSRVHARADNEHELLATDRICAASGAIKHTAAASTTDCAEACGSDVRCTHFVFAEAVSLQARCKLFRSCPAARWEQAPGHRIWRMVAEGDFEEICSDTCPSAHDGLCDDGGPGSDTNACAIGTDCADCGVRDPSEPLAACVEWRISDYPSCGQGYQCEYNCHRSGWCAASGSLACAGRCACGSCADAHWGSRPDIASGRCSRVPVSLRCHTDGAGGASSCSPWHDVCVIRSARGGTERFCGRSEEVCANQGTQLQCCSTSLCNADWLPTPAPTPSEAERAPVFVGFSNLGAARCRNVIDLMGHHARNTTLAAALDSCIAHCRTSASCWAVYGWQTGHGGECFTLPRGCEYSTDGLQDGAVLYARIGSGDPNPVVAVSLGRVYTAAGFRAADAATFEAAAGNSLVHVRLRSVRTVCRLAHPDYGIPAVARSDPSWCRSPTGAPQPPLPPPVRHLPLVLEFVVDVPGLSGESAVAAARAAFLEAARDKHTALHAYLPADAAVLPSAEHSLYNASSDAVLRNTGCRKEHSRLLAHGFDSDRSFCVSACAADSRCAAAGVAGRRCLLFSSPCLPEVSAEWAGVDLIQLGHSTPPPEHDARSAAPTRSTVPPTSFPTHQPPTAPPMSRPPSRVPRQPTDWELFDAIDADGDGRLSRVEIYQYTLNPTLGVLAGSFHEFGLFVTGLDTSGDGYVNYSEFVSGVDVLRHGSTPAPTSPPDGFSWRRTLIACALVAAACVAVVYALRWLMGWRKRAQRHPSASSPQEMEELPVPGIPIAVPVPPDSVVENVCEPQVNPLHQE